MNKKILFLMLLGVLVSPAIVLADLPGMINHLSKQLALMGGGLAIIGFVVAGIMYITSTANPSNMSVAKQALTAAIIGTVILILSGSAWGFVNGLFF